ncbi:hypothetical protein HRI_004558400 [Hibiscus trionum]|uniref:Putative plant transposon protein domain-containing protein n=1 Tax=Hibiscus trionum TaxID=183268 RepID=A0A9W7MQC6_HIBTR|nr:hypothetical protein HRI_004558400 [Hibiscus trionum]
MYEPTLKLVFVQGHFIPQSASSINNLFNTVVNVDEHVLFVAEIIDEKLAMLVEDLCVPSALWSGTNARNFTMLRKFLTLPAQIWFQFINSRLLPSTHSTTISLDRMCLIHSIIKGRKIDVGQSFTTRLKGLLKRRLVYWLSLL